MSAVPIARLIVAALVFPVLHLHAAPAVAESLEIDLPGAIERARRAAPEAIAARGDIAIAEAARVGAELAFTTNPEIEVGAGPRLISDRPIDVEARLEQSLEPGRRGARRRHARAELAHAVADAGRGLRALDAEVAGAFYDALYADRTVALARDAEELARRADAAAERRRKAGDITDLDANLARTALGRARAAVQASSAERAIAVGRLAALIGAGLGDAIVLRGELTPAAPAAPPSAAVRADLRALDAERDAAAAEHAQAVASARPELALWASYRREDTTDVVLGGLRFTLPLWNRGQGERAAAQARQHRAIDVRAATARVAERELADARAAYDSARGAVEAFERDVVPLLDASERLLQKTVDAGQISVGDYLVARQELLDGRREHLERQRALAKAAVAVDFAGPGAVVAGGAR